MKFRILPSVALLSFSVAGCTLNTEEIADGEGPAEVGVERQALTACEKVGAKYAANPWLGEETFFGCSVFLGGGAMQEFENGNIYVAPPATSKAWIVHGLILAKYRAVGEFDDILGFPTSDESDPLFGGGRYSSFEFGTILWLGGFPAAFEVHGSIRSQWAALGFEWGTMGFPLSDEDPISNPARRKNKFQFGRIYWTSSKGPWPVVTGSNPNAHFTDVPSQPQITVVSIAPLTNGSAHVSVNARGFTPGATVTLRFTHPETGKTWTSPSATVAFNGIVNVQSATGVPVPKNSIVKVAPNNFATLWVYQDDTHQAAIGTTTTAGINYTGTL